MLLANGHIDAQSYIIGRVWSEARIVRQRLVAERRHEALMIHTVVTSVLSEKGGKLMKEYLQELDDGY